ncbi:MAG: hypothetical protein ACQKBU_01600 [Verrucomicrobiales bacterium]
MKPVFPIFPAIFLALSLPSLQVSYAQDTESDDETESAAVESDSPKRFWQASLPSGHYMVALDRISNISMHEYLLDGNLVVNEVTVDTTGRALARFYYIEPLAESMKRNEVTRTLDKGRGLIERAGQRLGSDAHNMAQKNYPTTTHAGMIEYRILHLEDLDALYDSLRKAWQNGRGRTLTLK